MSRLFATGAAGFIGSNFVNFWHNSNPEDTVVVLDALSYAGNKANLASCEDGWWYTFIEGSICDQKLVETLFMRLSNRYSGALCCGKPWDRSITSPDAFIDTNIVGTYTLLKCAKKVWLEGDDRIEHLFHHVSTDEVYGTLREDDPAFCEHALCAEFNSTLRARRRQIILCVPTIIRMV